MGIYNWKKILVAVLLLMANNSFAEQPLKMIWWNVAWGNYNTNSTLDNSLLKIKKDINPDIIILGEYKSGILDLEKSKKIAEGYKYKNFVTYDDESLVGILVLSKKPMKLHRSGQLDWGQGLNTEVAKLAKKYPEESKYWNRSWSHYSIEVNGKELHFMPVHLLMPWKAYYKENGALDTISELIFGYKNPLWYQVAYLKGVIEYYQKQNLMPEDILLLGDFNVPNAMGPFTPEIYEDIADDFEPVEVKGKSFPTPAAEKDASQFKGQQVTIDLAFRNKHYCDDKGVILKYIGSDHYPLFLNITP